jgi:hypothetical protein
MAIHFELLDPEDKCTTILPNVRNHLPNYVQSYPRRLPEDAAQSAVATVKG